MRHLGKAISLILLSLAVSACTPTRGQSEINSKTSSAYGVFLSLEGEEAIAASEGYETVVVDAQYLSSEEISAMKDRNQKVYSYINIGSLETFRPYYEEYKHLALKSYANWEEEYWVDVSNKEWQEFIKETLVKELLKKDIDGFFVDNVDIYGQFPDKETYIGIETILKDLMTYEKEVIINSGDEFVSLYLEKNQQVDDILTAVNQETVFSSIDFENETFGTQTHEEKSYYLEYLNSIDQLNKDVYLLEYSTDKKLIKKINAYARKKKWKFYIANSIELGSN